MLKPFLTANWRYLAMLNFAVDPKILAPHVPAGTELDFYHGETYLTVVGFLFCVFYGEPYFALPMRSEVEDKDGVVRAKYEWRRGKKWEHLAMSAEGEPRSSAAGSA